MQTGQVWMRFSQGTAGARQAVRRPGVGMYGSAAVAMPLQNTIIVGSAGGVLTVGHDRVEQ